MIQAIQTSKTDYRVDFDSFAQLMDASESPLDPKCVGKFPFSSHEAGNENWNGTKTYAEAMELARLGWKDGLDKIQAMTLSLAQVSSKIIKDSYRNEIVGSWVDVGAFVNGQPDCMIAMHQDEHITGGGTKRIIKLVVNCSVTNSISEHQILIRGSAVCALVQCLECSGYSVEIIGVSCTRSLKKSHKDDVVSIYFPIKKAGDSIEADRLAFFMGHPSMPRRIMFSIKERLPFAMVQNFELHALGGYGTSHNIPTEEQGDIYIPCAYGVDKAWENMETAKAWVVQKLKEQGIEFEN